MLCTGTFMHIYAHVFFVELLFLFTLLARVGQCAVKGFLHE